MHADCSFFFSLFSILHCVVWWTPQYTRAFVCVSFLSVVSLIDPQHTVLGSTRRAQWVMVPLEIGPLRAPAVRFGGTICDAAGAALKRVRGDLSFEAVGEAPASAADATYALRGSYEVADCTQSAMWSEPCTIKGFGRIAAGSARTCAVEIETTERRSPAVSSFHFIYRYILCESCSRFDSLPSYI